MSQSKTGNAVATRSGRGSRRWRHPGRGHEACELGATDLYALTILHLTEAMTSGELTARTGLTTGPTTRLIDRLEQAGHVRRVPAPDDRRKVIVEPVGCPAVRTGP
ncbi:MarR family transcriptional regulator [Streptomyces rhizoryzae]|uniref:MarR family transcriptional regulator n=1 Tax=Streptomyces rhizoryzae TaxID=2932493 RepID=UPI0027E43A6C|nr:MarR family transcriptional regulator [Streptomyces rhizoryzae]